MMTLSNSKPYFFGIMFTSFILQWTPAGQHQSGLGRLETKKPLGPLHWAELTTSLGLWSHRKIQWLGGSKGARGIHIFPLKIPYSMKSLSELLRVSKPSIRIGSNFRTKTQNMIFMATLLLCGRKWLAGSIESIEILPRNVPACKSFSSNVCVWGWPFNEIGCFTRCSWFIMIYQYFCNVCP